MLDSTNLRTHKNAAGSSKGGGILSDESLTDQDVRSVERSTLQLMRKHRWWNIWPVAGQEHASIRAEERLGDHRPRQHIADKGYESNTISLLRNAKALKLSFCRDITN